MTTYRSAPESTAERSKVDRVYHHLRRLIRDMQLAPGTHLQKDHIAAELGVSRAPVSEAISRLADEMLVDVYPRHGSFVAPIRPHELRECMFIRTALEIENTRRVAAVADDDLLHKLETNIHKQQQAFDHDELYQLCDLDAEFHSILYEVTDFQRAANLSTAARVSMDRPRQFASVVRARAESTIREHQRIVSAIALKDPEFAAAAMRAHLEKATEALEQALAAIAPESTLITA